MTHRFQFSLRALSIFIVAASFALAAMRFVTAGWANAVVNITIFALLFSIVLAAYRRPFWIGFAICGIGYLALVESHFAGDFVERLITTRTVYSLRDMFHPQQDYFPPGFVEANRKGLGANFNRREVVDDTDRWQAMVTNFRLIGTCIWVLILATLGGMPARFAAGRPRGQVTPDSSGT